MGCRSIRNHVGGGCSDFDMTGIDHSIHTDDEVEGTGVRNWIVRVKVFV